MIVLYNVLQRGVAGEECVVFKATGLDDVGKYVAFLTKEISPGRVRAKPTDVLWLPDQPITIGDFIYLYTGPGTPHSISNQLGTKTYFYYWGLSTTALNNPLDKIVLLKIESWFII